MGRKFKPILWASIIIMLNLGWIPGALWVKLNEKMLASGLGFETFDFPITRLMQPNSCP